MEDVVIETLIIEPDREEHIAKHDIAIKEVLEVLSSEYVFIAGKLDRRLLIGKTKKKRFLTIVLGVRKGKNIYGLVTARPSRRVEKSFYHEFLLEGGDKDDKN